MGKIWLFILLFGVVPVFGQLEPNTVTIAATRSISLQPDQVVYSLSVNSALNATLDQIVAALSGLGITSANLTGVNNNSAPQTLQWSFTLAAPFSNLAATIGSLIKLQQTITQNNSGLALTFSIAGTQVSAQLQQSQSCSNSGLIADATAQAQKLAAAAGLTLGPILKLSNTPLAGGLAGYVVPAAVRLGEVSDFLLGAAQPTTCSLVVQFQLQL